LGRSFFLLLLVPLLSLSVYAAAKEQVLQHHSVVTGLIMG
jgi:hypothetical protein